MNIIVDDYGIRQASRKMAKVAQKLCLPLVIITYDMKGRRKRMI